ncbi:MAG: hypothetical protein A2017_21875 [Lentisphaerae bacterium GWF2_44_16]|nr:MAG: hypothetical protein A2017_21875 [Lentisphaerae bacterium GWF2_44_16]
MRIKREKQRYYRDFTLLELMIVITIIMILTALLLPSLKKAKETAHSISCQGNLKQTGVALSSYANDFNGNIMYANPPYVKYYNGVEAIQPWYLLLGSYGPYSILDYGVKIGRCGQKNRILCPMQTISDSAVFSYADYSCNIWFMGTSTTGDSYLNHSLQMMQTPSEAPLIFDNGRVEGYGITVVRSAMSTFYEGYHLRANHNKSANVLFGGMNARSVKRDELGADGTFLRKGFNYATGNE